MSEDDEELSYSEFFKKLEEREIEKQIKLAKQLNLIDAPATKPTENEPEEGK